MVLNEQAVPSVAVNHQALPLVEDLLDLIGVPVSESHAEATLVIVNVDHLENEDHVELATLRPDDLQNFFLVTHERHLTDCDGVILAENLAVHCLQELVQAWAVGIPFVAWLVLASRRGDWRIWITRRLRNVIYDIHTEPTCATLEPEV